MSFESFKGEGQSEWDGRQFFTTRLHNAIIHAHNSMFVNDYEGWYKALTVLRMELSNHVRTDEEKQEIQETKNKMKTAFYNLKGLSKMELFIECQEDFMKIIRKRGFDVPINERDPGHVLR